MRFNKVENIEVKEVKDFTIDTSEITTAGIAAISYYKDSPYTVGSFSRLEYIKKMQLNRTIKNQDSKLTVLEIIRNKISDFVLIEEISKNRILIISMTKTINFQNDKPLYTILDYFSKSICGSNPTEEKNRIINNLKELGVTKYQ